MAPLSAFSSTVLTSTGAYLLTMPSTTPQPPNDPTLYVPDTKARNAIIFGTIATLLTTMGIIIAGATLHIARQSPQTEHHHEPPVADSAGTELDSIEGSHTTSHISISEPTTDLDEV